MNPEDLLPEQRAQLLTWAEQRDELLLELSGLRTENEKLQSVNINLSASNTDLETRANEVRGRIEELKLKEQEFIPLVSKEVELLRLTKTGLESEVMNLKTLIEALTSQKTSLENDVSFALSTFNIVKNEGLLLEKVVDKVTVVSNSNVDTIEKLIDSVKNGMNGVIEVSNNAINQVNAVVSEVPKMLVESRRQSLERTQIKKVRSLG